MAKKRNSKGKIEVDAAAAAKNELTAEQQAVAEKTQLTHELSEELADDWLIEASHSLHDKRLDEWTVGDVARAAVADLRSCLGLCFISHDKGDKLENCDLISQDEPLPPRAIDNWARGCIPTKARPRKEWATNATGVGGKSNKLPSEAGRSVARSVRSRARPGGRRSAESIPRFGGGNANKDDAVQRCIIYLEDGDEVGELGTRVRKGRNDRTRPGSGGEKIFGSSGLGGGGRSSMNSNSSDRGSSGFLSSGEEVRMMALRKLESREKAEKERRQALLKRASDEDERNQKLARDLKGKEYTFDHEGGIIMMNPVQADKLPPTHYNVGMALRPVSVHEPSGGDPGDTSLPPPQSAGGATGNKSTDASGTDGTGSGGAGKTGEASLAVAAVTAPIPAQMAKERHYKAAVSFQQRILKNPSLSVQAGVVFREAGDTVIGPPHADLSNHMSRKNFTAHQSSLETESESLKESAGGGSGGGATPSGGREAVVGVGASPQPSARSSTSKGGAEGAGETGDTALPPNTLDSLDQLDSTIMSTTPKSYTTKNSPTGPNPAKKRLDPNFALIRDPNWGQNLVATDEFIPAQLPRNHTKSAQARRQKQAAVTQVDGQPSINNNDSSATIDASKRKPRDRPYVETRTSKERKFLPAPVYPANTGFGMNKINGVTTNPNSPAGSAMLSSTNPSWPSDQASKRLVSSPGSPSSMAGGSVVNYQQKTFQRKSSDRVNVASDRADRWLGVAASNGPVA